MGGSLYTKRFELFLPSDLETPAVGTGSHVWCHSTCTRGSGGGGAGGRAHCDIRVQPPHVAGPLHDQGARVHDGFRVEE